MYFDAQFPGLAQVAERQFEWVNTDAVGFVHGAAAVGIVDIVALDFIDAEDSGVIAENIAHDAGLIAQKLHLAVAVGDVKMPSGLWLAFGKLGHQLLEGVEAFADFCIQFQGHVLAPALYPLRAIEAAAGILPWPPLRLVQPQAV